MELTSSVSTPQRAVPPYSAISFDYFDIIPQLVHIQYAGCAVTMNPLLALQLLIGLLVQHGVVLAVVGDLPIEAELRLQFLPKAPALGLERLLGWAGEP